MDEELQRRNTDCVYFLASPLTCKKGVDCEYRHSETARLNPRDCWYWLSGSCLNPTCAFRHPPMDVHLETASESTVPNQPPAAPVNKTNFPCYFYFNGFCNKGEKCIYLHGPDETAHTWKSSKTASAAVDGPSSEKKVSNNSVPVPVETQSLEMVPKGEAGMKIGPKKELRQPPSNNIAERRASQLEEVAAIRSNSGILEETFVHSRSQESTGLSSGDQKLDPVEREEWLESSPGFDVLVDGSEDFDCEDDAYVLHHDAEDHEHYGKLSGYDYEDNVEHDPAYPDLRNSFDREVRDGYRRVDDEDMNSVTKYSFCGNDRIPDRTLHRKRTLYQEELDSGDRSGVDLRDYLKKRRVIDDQYPTYSEIRERPRTVSGGHLRGRLGSKVEVYSAGSQIDSRTRVNDTYKPARSRHSIVSSSRNHLKQRRPAEGRDNFSEISRKIASRRPKSDEVSTLFSGPKSLAQIKEEKRKTLENGDYSDGTGS